MRFSLDTSTANQPLVTDNVTGLRWQGCALGYSGDSCDTTGSPTEFTWADALAGCESLSWGGYTDWRLPNKKELRSIVDNRENNPAIDTTAFPATPSDSFWTSSFHVTTSYAFCVRFYSGDVSDSFRSGSLFVRCVRGGP